VVLRGPAAAPEAVRGGRARRRLRHRHVPALARQDASRRLVSEYGHAGLDRFVLRHVHLPLDPVRRYDVCGPARSLAVSESIRGCWVL